MKVQVTCEVCGESITTGRKDKKYCSIKCGNQKRNKIFKQNSREKFLSAQRRTNNKRRKTPEGKYLDHKHRAKQSGIEFNLTFEEWWNIWEPFWEQRGLGNMVMCRTHDRGAYEIGNVRIDTQANNNKEAYASGARKSRKGLRNRSRVRRAESN